MTWTRQPISTLVSHTDGDGIDLTEAKLFLRVDTTADDTLIETLITAARSWVEAYTRRTIITETWDFKYAGFPAFRNPLIIPRAPLQSITAISYLDEDNVSQTWASTNYTVQKLSGPMAGRGWIETNQNTDIPALSIEAEYPVTVRAVCGYGNGGAVPKGIKSAMLLLLGDLYTQRQETIVGTISSKTQTTLDRLLGPYRLPEAS